VLEHVHTRPGILRAFGWQVAVVVAKDWWHEPEAVLTRIELLLRREIAEVGEAVIEEEPLAPPTEVPALKPAEPPAPAPAPLQTTAGRRFEFIEGNSRKFWAVAREDASLIIRFGRIGTTGQVQTKTFADEPRAEREMAKLIAEKIGKGYNEVI
jgi:predicted DNA-binding WGR domain protein